ncbi:hypothetical protein [Billgrantia lactosivorans]|uniref:hypothetical protein n=1 Tax=Billgrantia lactosivorans TaxID=2185141 RepID=UPI000DAD6142|nr:hypothetical protein [Halomonas lactosivorans]
MPTPMSASCNASKEQGEHLLRQHPMLAALFSITFWSVPVAALGEGEVFLAEDSSAAARQELDASHLDDIRGRYAPAPELGQDKPWGVVLWDERGGSPQGSDSGGHQSQAGNNQQRQSMRTETIR